MSVNYTAIMAINHTTPAQIRTGTSQNNCSQSEVPRQPLQCSCLTQQ